MEFKFRAVDDRPPPFPSPATNFDHFEQPLPVPGQSITSLPNFSPLPLANASSGWIGNPGPNSGLLRNPSSVQGLLMRDPEKELISEEMIVEEIARRRELEAVVRGEIRFLERQMAMRRAAMGGMSFGDGFPPAMQFTPFEFPLPSPAFAPFPLGPPPEDIAQVIKAPSEIQKDKLIVLAKPDPRLSQAKRKALGPPVDANEVHPFGLKKKPKEEFSCALCQVSATCEKDLNNHLQGKKHKRKEAVLKKQKMAKNPGKAPCPKKIRNPSGPKMTSSSANSNSKESKSVKKNLSQNGLDKEKEDAVDIKPKNELVMLKDQNAEELNKKRGSKMVHKADGSAEKMTTNKTGKKFKFWCEMCQAGSFSSIVMGQHKKGKKHRARLLGCETAQTSVAVPEQPEEPGVVNQANGKTSNDMANSEAVHEKPEDTGVANQATRKMTDDMETIEAVHEKPEDTDIANQVNGKTADDMAHTEAFYEKPEDTDVLNQADEKTIDDMANMTLLLQLRRLQNLCSVDGQN